MEEKNVYEVIIIGGGPAGISAGIWCARLGIKALILEQMHELGGQLLQIHNPIIDYPGVIVQNGKILQQQFKDHLQQLSIQVMTNHKVIRVEKNDPFEYIVSTNHGQYFAKYLIFSSGSQARKLHVPGEEKLQNEGNYSSQKNLEVFLNKRVLIVGGGDRAMEGAVSIAKVANDVTVVHRQEHFRARPEFLEKLAQFTNVHLLTPYVVKNIEYKNDQKYVTITHVHTQDDQIERYDLVLIRIGREPVDHFISLPLKRKENGWIEVDENGRTSVDTIFAIGDLVTSPTYSSIVQAIGQGMRAAKTIYEDMRVK